MKISEIKELNDGTAVDSLSGLVENVYERKAGKSKKGFPYSFQGIVLKDSSGTIKVTLDGRKECPQSLEGKEVVMSSVRGERGLEGVLKKTDRYVDKQGEEVTKVAVYVSNVAKVAVNGAQQAVAVIANTETMYLPPGAKKPTMVLGQTVGMAINNAVHIILATVDRGHSAPLGISYYAGDDFVYDLHAVASSIIHVSKALESGEELKRPGEVKPIKSFDELAKEAASAISKEESEGQNFLDGGQADPEIF